MNSPMSPIFGVDPLLQNYAEAHGEMNPQRAWILTPVDVWIKNPYYTGSPVPHPEDDRD